MQTDQEQKTDDQKTETKEEKSDDKSKDKDSKENNDKKKKKKTIKCIDLPVEACIPQLTKEQLNLLVEKEVIMKYIYLKFPPLPKRQIDQC